MGVLQPDLFKRWNLGGTGGEGVLSSEFYVGGGASTKFSKKQLSIFQTFHVTSSSCPVEKASPESWRPLRTIWLSIVYQSEDSRHIQHWNSPFDYVWSRRRPVLCRSFIYEQETENLPNPCNFKRKSKRLLVDLIAVECSSQQDLHQPYYRKLIYWSI